ncbi:MAG TPA: 3-oxoacyl-ACP reductase family protein [Candidatus Methylomirabilis sp.]|nr:3-oxoacyl-ACP reductase family protein [Candidatus Methylomirabilis sp.]
MGLPEFSLDEKIAFVTGAGRGLGQAGAIAFARAGAHAVLVSRSRSQLEETAAAVERLGRKALVALADVRKAEEVEEAVRAAVETFGRIDILFNNAGTNVRKPVVEMTDEDWRTIIETNVKGVFVVARAVARQMIAQRSGRMINMSSVTATLAERNKVVYASSKGAIAQFTKGLAIELAPYGITVNAIAPGYVMTPLVQGYLEADAERYKRILARIPLSRIGQPEEIGGALVFLASDAASYITGASIAIDGGWAAG